MSENENLETTEGRWWSEPKFVMCAVAIALGLILAIVLLLFPTREEQPAAESETSEPVTEAPADDAGDSDSESVCGLDGNDETSIDKAPEASWDQAIGGISVPVSEDHGPGERDESTGVRSCFAHSPEGAVLAAANLVTASGDPDVLRATTEQRAVDNPGKDVALEQLAQDAGGSAPPMQVAGFRLLSYDQETATVEVVMQIETSDEPVLITTGADLVWTDGDWHARYKDDGSGGPVSGEVSSLSGYTTWGPNDG